MSLHGAYDPDNIFAKILRGAAPAIVVYDDAEALAFLDIFPQSRGHTLVIPKGVDARNFLELPAERVGSYMTRVQRVAQAVTRALSPDGVIVTQFNGAPAGQTVFHLHFHIIPRWEGVALKGHGQAPKADMDALHATAAAIRAAF
ncbi:MAG: HIT family protein [Hyphomonadaceae bacterium]|nr:HIT family protein [Hyphomonadaceae bacterium]